MLYQLKSKSVFLPFLASQIFLSKNIIAQIKNAEICTLPKAIEGDCRASHGVWTYDSATNTCDYFNYGGCGGNANNFKNPEDCLKTCGDAATQPNVDVYLVDVFGFNWKDDPESETIKETFVKHFETIKKTAFPDDAASICNQPKAVVGSCRASLGRWTYDAQTNSIEYFTYGGCDGNENNFEDLEECLAECGSATTGLELDMYLRDYYGFDWEDDADALETKDKYLEWFKNLKKEKFAVVVTEKPDIQPTVAATPLRPIDYTTCHYTKKHSGNTKGRKCKKKKLRFYFNKDTNSCNTFIFSGCGGNANNFKTVDDCVDRCAQKDTKLIFEEEHPRYRINKNKLRWKFENRKNWVVDTWEKNVIRDENGNVLNIADVGAAAPIAEPTKKVNNASGNKKTTRTNFNRAKNPLAPKKNSPPPSSCDSSQDSSPTYCKNWIQKYKEVCLFDFYCFNSNLPNSRAKNKCAKTCCERKSNWLKNYENRADVQHCVEKDWRGSSNEYVFGTEKQCKEYCERHNFDVNFCDEVCVYVENDD